MMLERNNANSYGMIVHWFIEPVSSSKENAFDIENPLKSKNLLHAQDILQRIQCILKLQRQLSAFFANESIFLYLNCT